MQNYTGMYGPLFKRYNSVSRKFVKLTRESASDRRNIKETADGAGPYENSEREVSGELSEDKISDIRYAIDDTLNEYIYYYNNERIVSKLKMSPVQYRTHSLAS